MPRAIPSKLLIEIDDREKRPLPFPEFITIPVPTKGYEQKRIMLVTKKKRLEAGDYRLASYPRVCVVERKAGQTELIQNLMTQDFRRFSSAIENLANSCTYPTLLIEATPSILLAKPTIPLKAAPNPDFLIHYLARTVIIEQGIHLLLAGQSRSESARRTLGRFLAHYMVTLALPEIRGIKVDKPKKG